VHAAGDRVGTDEVIRQLLYSEVEIALLGENEQQACSRRARVDRRPPLRYAKSRHGSRPRIDAETSDRHRANERATISTGPKEEKPIAIHRAVDNRGGGWRRPCREDATRGGKIKPVNALRKNRSLGFPVILCPLEYEVNKIPRCPTTSDEVSARKLSEPIMKPSYCLCAGVLLNGQWSLAQEAGKPLEDHDQLGHPRRPAALPALRQRALPKS